MTVNIDQIVSPNATAEFRNDVQLLDYRSEHNEKLLEGYIFTRKAVAQKKSSVDLLKLLCESYTPGMNPNRFVFIATYGHGKSHFALSLANYFGKPASSSEIKILSKNIDHAVNDQALIGYFKDFKQVKKPYLVLIMSGIEQRDLSTQFYNAVDAALKDSAENRNVELPFWYKDASRYLESVRLGGDKVKANQILDEYDLDLEVLIERVKQNDSSTYDICYNLCLKLIGIAPNFGSTVNLKEAVKWLSDNLCGINKPYSGVLILFDEFSAFVRDYGLSMSTRPGTPLQDLLDGVDSCKEKVTFVAFSQHPPETVARSVLHGNTNLQSLLIQLNRLPNQQQLYLHSCMEEVLDAYLKQDNKKWIELCGDPNFNNELFTSNDVTLELFKSRYENELSWDSEHFQNIVTTGCFPLHPMTTALLSSIEFQETTNPRSVLGFVLKTLENIKDQPAIYNKRPNWILATTLVEHFKEMLGAGLWKDYIDAISQAGGPDAIDNEVAVLKGMVLQKAANVTTRQFGFDKVIGQFSGISTSEATSALQGLAGRGVIRQDGVQKLYMFWPAGKGANKVEELLDKKVASITSLNNEVFSKVTEVLRKDLFIKPTPIAVGWGHRDDWQADEIVASRELLTEDWLKKLVFNNLHQRLAIDGVKSRGLIVWLIASSEEDIKWYREELPVLLTQVFSDALIPVVFKRPKSFAASLISQLKRAYGLTKFSSPEIQSVGSAQYDAVVIQNQINLKEQIAILRSNSEDETLQAFRARIKAIRPPKIDMLFDEVYKMAYFESPKKWFNQYTLNQASLKSATKLLIWHLLTGTLDAPQALSANNIAKEAVNLFLKNEWGIVDSSYRLKAPLVGTKVHPAWCMLEDFFSIDAGKKSVKMITEQLLNVPYGYDLNTVSILFSAWCGFNRHELEISENSKIITVANLETDLKSFIKHLGDLSIKRRNPNELKGKVNAIVKVIQSGSYTIDEATKAINILREYISISDADDKQNAQGALSSLDNALTKALNYDKVVDNIYMQFNGSCTFSALFSALNTIKDINYSNLVTPINESKSEIKKDILARIDKWVSASCNTIQSITKIADYALNLKQLTDLKSQLSKHDLTNSLSKVDNAISNLNQCKDQLENQEKDREAVAFISGLGTTGNLAQLRSSLETLLSMKLSSDIAKSKLLEKTTAISNEIERISNLLLSICNRFEAATNSQEIKSLLLELNRIQPSLENTEEHALVTTLISRCIMLDEFLNAVGDIQREEPKSPAIIARITSELNSLQSKYKTYLISGLVNIIPTAIAKFESFALEKQREALKWVENLEKELNSKRNPSSVLDSLKYQPKFISAEASQRADALRRSAQLMLDEDQVLHIVSIFNTISDPKKRQECLKQLQTLTS